jgi:hypothetical protein
MVNIKFLGWQIDNQLNWKNHTDQMIPQLNGACYNISSVVHISNINTLKLIHNAYVHSVVKYGIFF